MWWLQAMAAHAAVPVTVCVDYQVDFVDSGVAGSTEDEFGDNSNQDALGIRITVTNTGGGAALIQQAGTSGSDAGCAEFQLTVGQTYVMRAVSIVDTGTGTYTATVRQGDAGPGFGAHYIRQLGTPLLVSGAATVHRELPLKPEWSALAVAGRAITRNQGGRPSLDLDLYVSRQQGALNLPAGCTGSGSCIDGTDLWLTWDAIDRKFKLAYFLGWAMLHDMGYDRSSLDRTLDDTHCRAVDSPLALGTIESTGTGFAEGYAFWYASTVFNHSQDTDCSFVYWMDANWDQLETCHVEEEVGEGHVLSCYGASSLPPYETLLPAANYRSYCYDERAPYEDAPDDSVVPLDVVRFFRELDRVYVTRNGVGDIMEAGVLDVGSPSDFTSEIRSEALSQGVPIAFWATQAAIHGLDQ
jgi:hypothetical protein